MPAARHFSLQLKLQLAFLLVSLLTVGIFTAQAVYSARQGALAMIDAQLVSAARSYVLLLGETYHDELPPREQVDLARKHAEALTLTRATDFLQLNYLYSYVVRDGKVFYTQASLSAEQAKDPSFEFYLKPSDTPETDGDVLRAIQTGQPVFLESENPQYGHLRSVFMPLKNSKGGDYVVCADISAELVTTAIGKASLMAVTTGILLLLAAIVVSLVLGRVIARPLQRLRDMMQSLTSGSGDLTIRLDVTSRDEIGEIAGYFNTFIGQLREMFLKVREDAVKLTSGVQSLSSMTEQLSSDARLQSDTASSTAATIEEITVSINHIADHTRDADRNVQETGRLSELSAGAVSEVADEVRNAADSVNNLAGVMGELDQSSQQISTIVRVIKEIADQTNLLALNAAIEAARAGEQGRGFAVVADEVRSLASRTQQSTAEIDGMISRLQDSARQAVQAMLTGQQQARSTLDDADQADHMLHSISGSIDTIMNMNTQIASATEQQTAVANEINRNLTNIRDLSHAALGAVGQINQAGSRLVDIVDQLDQMTSGFRTRQRRATA